MSLITTLLVFLTTGTAFANDYFAEIGAGEKLAGNWHTSSVRCVAGRGSKPPAYAASVELQMTETGYVANGKVASFSCRFSGPYTKRGSIVSFKIANDGGCPLGSYLNSGFTGQVNGARMVVKLGTKVGEALCDDAGSNLHVILSKGR